MGLQGLNVLNEERRKMLLSSQFPYNLVATILELLLRGHEKTDEGFMSRSGGGFDALGSFLFQSRSRS